jgi:SOS response regulatory protein OraA/RecX
MFGKPKAASRPRALKPCRDYALGLIAKRDYAVAELARKLRQKGYPGQEVQPLVAEFAERELVSDVRYATNRWRYRQESSRWGKTRIVQELKQAGVAASVLAKLIETHHEADEEPAQPNWLPKNSSRLAHPLPVVLRLKLKKPLKNINRKKTAV